MGKEKEIADAEEMKVAKINEEVSKKQQDCERDLAKAEPALLAAKEALNTLNKVNMKTLCIGIVLYFCVPLTYMYVCIYVVRWRYTYYQRVGRLVGMLPTYVLMVHVHTYVPKPSKLINAHLGYLAILLQLPNNLPQVCS